MKYLKSYNETLKNKEDNINDELCDYCIYGDIAMVKMLISKGADVNHDFGKPLKHAAECGHLDVVKLLLRRGAEMEWADSYIEKLSPEVSEYLLEYKHRGILGKFKGFFTNESVKDFMKPKSKDDIVKSLEGLGKSEKLDKIFDLGMSNLFTKEELHELLGDLTNREKLHLGCERGIFWLVQEAIDNGVDIHVWDEYAVRAACQFGNIDIVKLLFDKGADIHIKNDCALNESVNNGQTEVVKFLLEHDANIHTPNNKGNLREASRRGFVEIVRMLLEKGADVHYDDDSALINVCRYHGGLNGREVIKMLLDAGADATVNNSECLRISIGTDGLMDVVEMLLDAGADPNVIKDNELNTRHNPKISELIKQYKDKKINI